MSKITFLLLLVVLVATVAARPNYVGEGEPTNGESGVNVIDGDQQVNVVDGDEQVNIVDDAGPQGRSKK